MRVSALARRAEYGVITTEIVDDICARRMLAADVLSRVDEDRVSHAAKMVMFTVEAMRNELMELIS